MSLSDDLLQHAERLLGEALYESAVNDDALGDVLRRRAISALYYALFHRINADAVNLLAPNVSESTNHRIQRWFSHGEMKIVCGRFIAAKLSQPLLDLIGPSASHELHTVALSFIQLQDARHRADYDLNYKFTEQDAWDLNLKVSEAVSAWEWLAGSAEANIFILSLLMWKNWDKERA